ncbi:kelch 5 isoform A [Chlorella sorokiniana]|uniref:Kelch 5 isoform A n=2 Tax=Chlorella sorokiniana TaxID=3076 RepID=A0A2P6TK60_CHLSO|nr:kelch 5 isoform A [Chlorella sorokiniana]|eukprot:PRW44473.1 kelch 5 isoform A [Chlorella sorokiniana]
MSHASRLPTPPGSPRTMLVRTSSGNQSVGHLSHSPHGFSALHRPDVTFSCGGLMFPVHSLLLSVSSRFFTEFFTYIKGQKQPEVISLDAVKCEALSSLSLGNYLEFVYSGCLPAFEVTDDAVELLRLGSFFSNAALVTQMCAWLGGQMAGLPEETVLEVFRAAVDLKQRDLVTECLLLLLPQFGSPTADSTVSEVIDYMDATLSKVVLTQLAMHGALPTAAALRRRSSSASSRSGSSGPASEAGVSEGSISISPCSQYEGTAVECTTPRTGRASSFSGISRRSSRSYEAGRSSRSFEAERAASVDALKRRFVETLEAKGWGM